MRRRRPSEELRSSCAQQAIDEHYDAFNALVRVVSQKEAAYLADTSPSQLANALARRNRDHLRIEWEAAIVEHEDVTQELVVETYGPIVALKRLQIVPIVDMTPEEELARTKAAMATLLHPDMQAVIEAHVKGRGR